MAADVLLITRGRVGKEKLVPLSGSTSPNIEKDSETRSRAVAIGAGCLWIAGVSPALSEAKDWIAGVSPALSEAKHRIAGVSPALSEAKHRIAGVSPALSEAKHWIAGVSPAIPIGTLSDSSHRGGD